MSAELLRSNQRALNPVRLGLVVRGWRAEANLTQLVAAARLGTQPSKLGEIERGGTASLDTYVKICNFYGHHIAELFTPHEPVMASDEVIP